MSTKWNMKADFSIIMEYFSRHCITMKIFYLLFFTFVLSMSFAQTKITVLDSLNKVPIVNANVYFPDTKMGVYTDSLGTFTVKTSSSIVLIQISAPGYQTLLENINLQNANQTFYLQSTTHELQEIVISTNSFGLQGENVMNVEKIKLKAADIQGISLSEKLSSLSGLSNYSTGTGIGKPVIRGLSGNRIAVFSQGIRIENQQWGDEHGLGLDENGYEQVEIIKGPASLLYGSDALGGIIYFIDEKFSKQHSIEAALNSEFNSNTLGLRNMAAFKFSEKQWHVNLFGGYTTHTDYKDGNNKMVLNSRFNTGDFKTVIGYTGNKFYTSLKYGVLKEIYGLAEESDEPASITNNNRQALFPFQRLSTHILSSENSIFLKDNSKLKIDAGYVFNNRQEFEDIHEEAELNMDLHTFSYNVKWFSVKIKEHWEFTAGSQGMFQKNKNSGEETLIPDASTTDFGVFTVSNYSFSKKSLWQFGIRFDTRYIHSTDFSKNYPAFNFSTGIFQPVMKNLSFRANISSGFRSPNMFELMSNGVHEGTNRYEIGNDKLRNENSYQIDLSLNYNSKHFEIFLNSYLNYIRNFIYIQLNGSEINNIPIYNYLQNDAMLYGGETGFHLHPHPLDWLHLESSYSATFGQQKQGEFLSLMPSQKINSTISASFAWKKCLHKFSIYVQHTYSFAQKQVANFEEQTPEYNLLNAGVSLEFQFNKQCLILNFAANNVLNKKYYDHLSRYKSEGILNMGRNFVVKLSLPLEFRLK